MLAGRLPGIHHWDLHVLAGPDCLPTARNRLRLLAGSMVGKPMSAASSGTDDGVPGRRGAVPPAPIRQNC